ncbi:MAG: hypothetical protein CO135_01145 [Candidatus Levybacteria bacterium CG_4_9_14_3_um_filter_35_16]|nr:MAG: hypothetical protein COW87_03080 [Candidatus Levybacteria bacterium CG22_combo_CG10-13_8_21_14_all_35_11]PIY93886.1 MAG: hypothetical protein COY68_04995 [Candidatus Levybacteria bacterium CG_4_10_14_0_8_um_filter_35_23]PJA91472.1 MAG: hypothetical protein CO135_01145 [Candidatus Levybacteria bacterium CG_4_9_14_3_um_filter_35_16]PJC54691.1 MAG: hypothetical protein CO028_00990 [Candidatus Levybacteria bacterium CG_4_9_14_0_2_um_filter_35_21]
MNNTERSAQVSLNEAVQKPLERIIFCPVSDDAITREVTGFLKRISEPGYETEWMQKFGNEIALVEENFAIDGPVVWHHWRDYLTEQKKDGIQVSKEVLNAAITHETAHVARFAARLFPLTVSQMTHLFVRPEITKHDLKEMKRAQIAVNTHLSNIERALILAERIKFTQK